MASLTDYGFPFNSVASDRTYNADVWRDYFKNLFTDGVVPDKLNEMVITESDTPAKSVKVGTGFVIIQGVQYGIETAQTLAITDNASGDDRIDRVVARLDYTNRTAELDILQGTPSATPSAPALTQNATTYEISLAQIYVSNGFTTILNANITDERAFAKVNVIFDADFLNSQSPSYYLARTNHTGTQLASTISNFASTVRSTVLTGLSTATNAVISTADSILTALGKLQSQITNHIGSSGSSHGTATTSTNGFMSSADKSKLDGIESGAEVNTVDSVDGRTGSVTLTDKYEPKNSNIQSHISSTSNPHSVDKADVGLGSVANYGVASQAEADAGAVDTKYMTPLKTMQAMVTRDSKGQIVPSTLIQNFSNLVYNKGSGYEWIPMGSITINPQNEPHCLLRIIPIQSTSLIAVRLKDGSGNFYFSTTPDPEDSDPPVSELDGYFPNLISTYNKGSITLYVEGFTPFTAEQTWELDFELYSAKKGVWE
jgi:hypothetical protein